LLTDQVIFFNKHKTEKYNIILFLFHFIIYIILFPIFYINIIYIIYVNSLLLTIVIIVQVRNSTDDLLHIFNNHTNKITGLEIIPGKPAFLSSSLDGSIGMFNLVNFQEIYRLYLKEPSCGIDIIDENQFLSYSEREVILWNFNNLTDCFTALR